MKNFLPKKLNAFSWVLIILAFAFVFRMFDLSGFSTPVSIAQGTPEAQKFEPVNEQPPPLVTKPEDAKKADDKAAEDKTMVGDAKKEEPTPVNPDIEPNFSNAEVEVLQSLAKRRGELDRREQRISQQEALIKASETEVDKKITELKKIRGELVELLNQQKTVEEERVNSLVKIYENMKPKEAARIFDTLEMDVLLAVIGKMSERKSSPILASMDPEKARTVTIKLAEQHKLPDVEKDAKKPAAAKAPATPEAPMAVTPSATPPAIPLDAAAEPATP